MTALHLPTPLLAHQSLPVLAACERPLIVVCGGIGVDMAKLDVWKKQFGLH